MSALAPPADVAPVAGGSIRKQRCTSSRHQDTVDTRRVHAVSWQDTGLHTRVLQSLRMASLQSNPLGEDGMQEVLGVGGEEDYQVRGEGRELGRGRES
jgi:hypothetical protein